MEVTARNVTVITDSCKTEWYLRKAQNLIIPYYHEEGTWTIETCWCLSITSMVVYALHFKPVLIRFGHDCSLLDVGRCDWLGKGLPVAHKHMILGIGTLECRSRSFWILSGLPNPDCIYMIYCRSRFTFCCVLRWKRQANIVRLLPHL